MSDICVKFGHHFSWRGHCERCGWSTERAEHNQELFTALEKLANAEARVLKLESGMADYRAELSREQLDRLKLSQRLAATVAELDIVANSIEKLKILPRIPRKEKYWIAAIADHIDKFQERVNDRGTSKSGRIEKGWIVPWREAEDEDC